MKDLIRHIEYLLQNHDCVVIPGLGAILAHGEHARCDSDAGLWHAPARVLSFNPELNRTDGLLAASVARREGISIEAAASRVSRAAAAMIETLRQEGYLELGAAGALTIQPGGSMAYEPGDAAWLSPSTLWLPTLNITPVAGASQIAREARKTRTVPAVLRHAASIAASIAAVVALGWAIRTTLPDASGEQFASVAPTSRKVVEVPSDNNSTLVLVIKHQPDDDELIAEESSAVIAEPAIETTAEVAPVKKAPVSPSATRLDADDPYILVVASLANRNDAEKFLNQYSNHNLDILAVGDRYRVYAATGRTVAEAAAAKSAVAATFPDGWVCRR